MARSHAADHGRRNFLQLAGYGLGVAVLAAAPARARAQTTTPPLKIGMVGAGRMGGALGALFVKAGHPVMFSSRHPENLKDLATRLGPLAQAGPDHADLERRCGRRLRPGASRPSGEDDHAKPAPGKLEKVATAVIGGGILCHIPLPVQVHATR